MSLYKWQNLINLEIEMKNKLFILILFFSFLFFHINVRWFIDERLIEAFDNSPLGSKHCYDVKIFMYDDTMDVKVGENGYPIIISPKTKENSDIKTLESWIRISNNTIQKLVDDVGVIIFRGFQIKSNENIDFITDLLRDRSRRIKPFNFQHRKKISDGIVSSTDYPHYYIIPQHLEMESAKKSPSTIFFYCKSFSPLGQIGGETPFIDFSKVYESLPNHLKEQFHNDTTTYIKTMPKDSDTLKNGWRDAFLSTKKDDIVKEVNEKITSAFFKKDILHFKYMKKPLVETLDNRIVFKNHLNHDHKSSFAAEYAFAAMRNNESKYLIGFFIFKILGFFKEDIVTTRGFKITKSDMFEIKRAIWKHTVACPHQEKDLIMINNNFMGHGRMVFDSNIERKIFSLMYY